MADDANRKHALQACMGYLAEALEAQLARIFKSQARMGYALLVYKPDHTGPGLFVTNSKADNVVETLRATADEIASNGTTRVEIGANETTH